VKLLNVGCGAVRPPEPWVNLDDLWSILKSGTPERDNLNKEPNYRNHRLSKESFMPFQNDHFEAVLVSHVVEHFDCQEASHILFDCRRVLKPGGLLVVSVPDAAYFMSVYDQDTPDKAVELFGEPICPAEPWHKSFFDYALWFNQHRQILTMPALECHLIRAGFRKSFLHYTTHALYPEVEKLMNRRKFSVELCAVK
jgi:predicted SAM-dependent methyltransferase